MATQPGVLALKFFPLVSLFWADSGRRPHPFFLVSWFFLRCARFPTRAPPMTPSHTMAKPPDKPHPRLKIPSNAPFRAPLHSMRAVFSGAHCSPQAGPPRLISKGFAPVLSVLQPPKKTMATFSGISPMAIVFTFEGAAVDQRSPYPQCRASTDAGAGCSGIPYYSLLPRLCCFSNSRETAASICCLV